MGGLPNIYVSAGILDPGFHICPVNTLPMERSSQPGLLQKGNVDVHHEKKQKADAGSTPCSPF